MEDFLIYAAKSTGFIALFYLCYRIFLHRETFFRLNRYFLLAGLLLAVVLPFWTITRIVDATPATYTFAELTGNPAVQDHTAGPDIWSVLFWTYISGAVFFAGRFLMQLWSLKRFLSGCKKDRQNGFVLMETTGDTTPFSFFNLIVYNPSVYSDKEKLNAILEHEKIHVLQKHSLDVLLMHLFMVFQWYNPVVWLYRKAVSTNLEYLADRCAVQKGINKKEYQYLLIEQTQVYKNYTVLTNTFFNSSIKKRVVMLNKSNSNRKQLWKYGIAIPALIVFLLAVNTETVAQERTGNDQKGKIENALVIIDGKTRTKSDLDNLDTDSIAEIEVLKGEDAIREHGEKAKGGVIRVFTKVYREKHPKMEYRMYVETSDEKQTIPRKVSTGEEFVIIADTIFVAKHEELRSSSGNGSPSEITSSPWKVSAGVMPIDGKQPRIVVDGEMKEKGFDINTLDFSKVKKTVVLKGEEAIKKYKEEGKDGVVEIYIENE